MTKEEITIEKFYACTGFLFPIMKPIMSSPTHNKYIKKYRIEDFSKKLREHKMDDFTEPLFHYMILEREKQDDKIKKPPNLKKYKQKIEFQEQLVEALKMLLTGDRVHSLIINKKEPYTIENKEIIAIILRSAIDSVSDEIAWLGLNEIPLTHEEAIQAINNQEDVEWIKKWIESNGYQVPNYDDFKLDKLDGYLKKIIKKPDIFGAKEKLLNNLISEYASHHPRELLLNSDTINQLLEKIREKKSKSGRKEETYNLKSTAYLLSNLIRLDRYLENEKIDKISEVKITNEDCRFVHDVMAFFELIDFSINKKTGSLEKRLRKMITDYKDKTSIEDSVERLKALKFC